MATKLASKVLPGFSTGALSSLGNFGIDKILGKLVVSWFKHLLTCFLNLCNPLGRNNTRTINKNNNFLFRNQPKKIEMFHLADRKPVDFFCPFEYYKIILNWISPSYCHPQGSGWQYLKFNQHNQPMWILEAFLNGSK